VRIEISGHLPSLPPPVSESLHLRLCPLPAAGTLRRVHWAVSGLQVMQALQAVQVFSKPPSAPGFGLARTDRRMDFPRSHLTPKDSLWPKPDRLGVSNEGRVAPPLSATVWEFSLKFKKALR
jgi:hypothetical protein